MVIHVWWSVFWSHVEFNSLKAFNFTRICGKYFMSTYFLSKQTYSCMTKKLNIGEKRWFSFGKLFDVAGFNLELNSAAGKLGVFSVNSFWRIELCAGNFGSNFSCLMSVMVLWKKVPNVLSRRHTKRRTGARGCARPSFGMTPDFLDFFGKKSFDNDSGH